MPAICPVLLQLLVLGLPIIPGSLDRYIQAKVKQYIIMPITNLLYLLFVQTLQLVVTAIYLILWSIFYVIYTILEVIYLDIAWFCKRFWWYTTWLGYFIHLLLLNLWTIFKTTILWTLDDIYWFGSVIISPFMWTYQTGQYL